MIYSVRTLAFTTAATLVLTPGVNAQDSDFFLRKAQAAGVIQAIVNADGKVLLDRNLSADKLEQVTGISAAGLTLNDNHVAAMSVLRNLTHLELLGSDVTDQGLARLCEINLVALGLAQTKVGDAGLALVLKMKGLKAIDLRYTKVTDKGLALLATHPGLTYVLLEGGTITEAGVAQLQKLNPRIAVQHTNANAPPARGPAAPKAKASREDILRERVAQENLILSSTSQLEKCQANAANLDQLAAQARREQMFTSAGAYSAQAAEYRRFAGEIRGDIAKARQRIAQIDAQLGSR